jgi:hypothetical protein
MTKQVMNYLKPGSLGSHVCMEGVSRSEAMTNLIIAFVDNTYDTLHAVSGFSEKLSWAFVVSCVYGHVQFM